MSTGGAIGYLAMLTREELIARVQDLESQVTRLRPLIGPAGQPIAAAGDGRAVRRRREGRVDFGQYRQRRIALRFAYLGWAFDGSAQQDNTGNTVLGRLCDGLKRVQLIESADTCDLVSCARTDKGVSALANVVSLNVRSLLADCIGCLPDSGPQLSLRRSPPGSQELDFVGPLNRVLPRELRVLAWAPVPADFSARFGCRSRQYMYHFPRAGLSVDRMRDACRRFLGQRDFRNFCKFSPDQVTYLRTVMESDIVTADGRGDEDDDGGRRVYVFKIRATAFLYHQIRNMFSVLALVGAGLEEPGIVDRMLDVESMPRKPEYVLADGLPLILSDTEFPDLDWQRGSPDAVGHLSVTLQRLYSELSVRSCLSGLLLSSLGCPSGSTDQLCSGLVPELRCRQHRPLLNRQAQPSFEELKRRADSKRQRPDAEVADAEGEDEGSASDAKRLRVADCSE